MRLYRFLLVLMCGNVLLQPALAQDSLNGGMYVDYQQFFSNLSFTPVAGRSPAAIQQDLKSSAARLVEDVPPATPLSLPGAGRKTLSAEAIYARRKNSVLMVGRLKKAGAAAGISFDITGTAFAITAGGVCVTNYHVLEQIITPREEAGRPDSAWFVITRDKRVFLINKIVSWSRNNDLAIFTLDADGARFDPLPLGKPAEEGASVYCLSHPAGYFWYFSKGIVARNAAVPGPSLATGFNPAGKKPVRMEVTADYGIGSSGGPIFDRRGNLAGIVSTTTPLGSVIRDSLGNNLGHQQMVVRDAVPVFALRQLLGLAD
ncbi:S1 family peptidase [Chitinophaga sp. NPDC101104]|uniref:S1 family peptidase n=1 Tax=Chitinophaga sp. NPDC101104 TaxID=3390561 RepID=UPI003CFF8B85